jgi:hypothetical protein
MGTCYQIIAIVVMVHMLMLKAGILQSIVGTPRVGDVVDLLLDNRHKSFQHVTECKEGILEIPWKMEKNPCIYKQLNRANFP